LDAALGPMESHPEPLVNSGLPKGAVAPPFELDSLTQLASSSPQVALLFVDPACSPCSALVPQITAWQREHGSSVPVVAISRGGQEENLDKYGALGRHNVLIQVDNEVSRDYQFAATPSAALVSSSGEVLETAVGAGAIVKLLADAAAKLNAPRRPGVAPLLSVTGT
jgi:hypothetical protein